jgi:hypothetical protein
MNRLQAGYYVFRSDLLERIRSYAFLLTMSATLLLAVLFVPPVDAHYAVVSISGFRGIYNAAWVGSSVAMSTLSCMLLLGFYLIKNTVERDRRTGVGQILESTSVSKLVYISGKFASNFMVLTLIVLITGAVSIFMVIVRGESSSLQAGALLIPFVVMVLPVIAVVAAVALVFESVHWLSGGLGNILYFFIWARLLDYMSSFQWLNGYIQMSSLMGFEVFYDSFESVFRHTMPGIDVVIEDGILALDQPLQTYVWPGLDWNLPLLAGRFIWILVALGLIVAAALLFRGFGHDRERPRSVTRFFARRKEEQLVEVSGTVLLDQPSSWVYSALPPIKQQICMVELVYAELKLMSKIPPWWWTVIAILGIGCCFLLPFDLVRGFAGPLCWVWPILLWSSLGVREKLHGTEQILFSSLSPDRRQLIATWMAGWLVTLFTGIGFGFQMMVYGGLWEGAAWFVGSLFIPTFALGLGLWTGTSKVFEVSYLLFIFVGLLNEVEIFDFMGSIPSTVQRGQYGVYFVLILLMVPFIFWARRHKLRTSN